MYCVSGTLVGARLGHVLFYDPAYYFSNPLEIFLPVAEINGSYKFVGFQGLASHGGALGFYSLLFCIRKNIIKNYCGFWIGLQLPLLLQGHLSALEIL